MDLLNSLYGKLRELADGNDGQATGNIGQLADEFGVTVPQIRKAFRELQSKGQIGKPYLEGTGYFSVVVY